MWGAYHRLRTAPTFVSDWRAFLSTSIRDKVFPWRAFLSTSIRDKVFPWRATSIRDKVFPWRATSIRDKVFPTFYQFVTQTANKDKVTQDQDGDSPDRCLTHAEQNALRYVAGYVLRKLRERGFGTSTTRRTCYLPSWKKKYDSISPLVKYRRISCCKYVAHIVSMAALAPRPQ